jgi:hypothetical protein
VLDIYECSNVDGTSVNVYPADDGTGTCQGLNQVWQVNNNNGTITNPYTGLCLDVYDFTGPNVDVWACNGGDNQAFILNSDGTIRSNQPGKDVCLAASIPNATSCANVWGRPLFDGSWAMTFINNAADALNVTCDASCFAAMNLTTPSLVVRDLWLHANLTTLHGGPSSFSFSYSVPGDGGSQMYRLFPTSP